MEKSYCIQKRTDRRKYVMRMNTIIEELDRSSKTIAPEKLQEVIKKIKEHKRIFVYGTGRSGLMLKHLQCA